MPYRRGFQEAGDDTAEGHMIRPKGIDEEDGETDGHKVKIGVVGEAGDDVTEGHATTGPEMTEDTSPDE